MKRIILSLILIAITYNLFSQNKKDLTISLGVGAFNSPYYKDAKSRKFYSFDFDYYLANRHILSANFLKGNHRFNENVNSNNAPLNTPISTNYSNAEAEYGTFSVLYKYKIINSKLISVSIGTGAGIMMQKKLYYLTPGSIGNVRESSWTDLVFPLRLDGDFRLNKHFMLGVLGGFYIHPDYPVLGNHLGTRVTYIFR